MNIVAIHEAAHATAGWALGIKVTALTIVPNERRQGVVWSEGTWDPMARAIFSLSGWLAESIAEGRPPYRVDWNRQEPDTREALKALDGMRNPDRARRVAELRTASLLSTRWSAVESVAEGLVRFQTISGREVDRRCVAAGILKAGQRRPRPFDPDRRFIDVGGRQVSMRKWADVVAASHFDTARAKAALVRGGR